MRTRDNLPVYKIGKRLQIDLSVLKRGYQSWNGSTEHRNSPFLSGFSLSTLSRTAFAVYIITTSAAVFAPQLSTPAFAATSAETTVKLIMAEDWVNARGAVMQSGNPVLYKLYEWALYREDLNNLPFDRISNFITRNPNWPEQSKLLATAERNMPDTLPAADIINWFTFHPPVTGSGIERLFRAGIATGQPVAPLINSAWPKATMDIKTQTDLVRQYGSSISREAQEARIDHLLDQDAYTLARGLGNLLQNGYPQLIEARIALREGKRGGEDLVYNVPKSLQNNSGLIFERIKFMRKNNSNAAAASLLNTASHINNLNLPEDWWKERNILVRRLIEDRNFTKAYALASDHGLTKGTEFAEAEWLAGWLALRFLNKPQIAYIHFTRMYGKVETAISKARGAYWSARAAEQLGQTNDSATWYYQAATYPHTYYGQIALKHLKTSVQPQTPAQMTQADHTAITSSDLVQAAVLLRGAGYDSLGAKFINAKLDTIQSGGEFQAFATYLKKIGDVSGAYRVAKRASWKNIFLGETAYPSLMKWVGSLSIDPALAHAIIRQESQFDTGAISPSGALGLMQLMPGTAKEVAKKRGWQHQTDWLTTRPDHNILLGSAYLNELLKRFDGSYPLAIAAYNAGPSRVRGWLEAFGDPRKGDVNWIDWLELIPVAETRNYVQRVTEGVVTYRDHLGMTH